VSAPLYVRDGSRFVVYDPVAQHVPPIPVPARVDDELLPATTDPANPQRTILAVGRCRHGSFARWAARNCCARR
jgi:hypothetical protein